MYGSVNVTAGYGPNKERESHPSWEGMDEMLEVQERSNDSGCSTNMLMC